LASFSRFHFFHDFIHGVRRRIAKDGTVQPFDDSNEGKSPCRSESPIARNGASRDRQEQPQWYGLEVRAAAECGVGDRYRP
jgi:hypothetical protein